MGAYSKTPEALVFDLIAEANPQLPIRLTPQNCRLGVPAAITPAAGTIWDTRVQVIPNKDSGYAGSFTVQYRRIDLAALLRNMRIEIDTYYSGSYLPKTLYIPALNDKFGLQLTQDDISTSQIAAGSTALGVVSACKAYKGSFNLIWTKGKQFLSEVVAAGPIAALFWPYNSEVVADKPQGEFMLYGVDFTADKATLAALSTGSALTTNSAFSALLNRINNLYDTNLSLGDPTVKGGLLGLVATRFTLPNTSVPQANSDNYTTVIAIAAKADSWFTGRLLLHYNA